MYVYMVVHDIWYVIVIIWYDYHNWEHVGNMTGLWFGQLDITAISLVLPSATWFHSAEIVTEGQTPGNAFSICQDENATVRAVELSPTGDQLTCPKSL